MFEYLSLAHLFDSPKPATPQPVTSVEKRIVKKSIKKKMSPDGKTLTIAICEKDETNNTEKILRSFSLSKTTPDEIMTLRHTLKPILVVKYLSSLYYCEVSKKFNVGTIPINHKCSFCKRCIAQPTECGGCDKVRDHFNQSEFKTDEYLSKIESCKRIEKYPFIGFGMETYNVINPNIVVSVCKDYAESESNSSAKAIYSFLEK